MNSIFGAITALALGVLATAAPAQETIDGDVTVIVPFAPGGAVDTTNRLIVGAANDAALLKSGEFLIENIANSVVGQATAARGKPDGRTVLAMTSSIVTGPKLAETPYKLTDFRAVALYGLDPEVIAVPAASPYQTIEDLIAVAKDKGISVVTSGVGTSHHMSGIALQNRTDMKLNIVNIGPFGEQVQQIAGGHVDAALWPYGEAFKQLEAGTIRVLAVASREREASMPDVPTWQEAGLNVEEFATFRGWGVPAATPDAAVEQLSGVMKALADDPAFVERMEEGGYDFVYQDAAQMQSVIDNYDALTTEIIDRAGDQLKAQ